MLKIKIIDGSPLSGDEKALFTYKFARLGLSDYAAKKALDELQPPEVRHALKAKDFGESLAQLGVLDGINYNMKTRTAMYRIKNGLWGQEVVTK